MIVNNRVSKKSTDRREALRFANMPISIKLRFVKLIAELGILCRLFKKNRARLIVGILLTVTAAHAQSDPWSRTAQALLTIFTGPLARAFVVVAIVISGITLAFSESGGKRGLAGLIFGGSLAIGAAQFATVVFG